GRGGERAGRNTLPCAGIIRTGTKGLISPIAVIRDRTPSVNQGNYAIPPTGASRRAARRAAPKGRARRGDGAALRGREPPGRGNATSACAARKPRATTAVSGAGVRLCYNGPAKVSPRCGVYNSPRGRGPRFLRRTVRV